MKINNSGDTQWQRISPLAIADFIVKFALSLLKENWAFLAPAFLFIANAEGNKLVLVVLAGLAILAAITIYAILYYISFLFYIDEAAQEFVVKRGVIIKERLTLKFERVQNINMTQPVYFRPFSLVNLIVDSAGSSTKEIRIVGIKNDYAREIRATLFARGNNIPVTDEASEEQVSDQVSANQGAKQEAVIFTQMRFKHIMQFGMSNFEVLLYVYIGSIPLIQHLDDYLATFFDFLSTWFLTVNQETALMKIITVIVVITAVTLIGMLISMVASVVKHFNFVMYAEEDKLRKVSGLLERHQIALGKRKIQGISLKQNVVAKCLGFYTVRYFQTSGGFNIQVKKNFIVPYVAKEDWLRFIQVVFPGFDQTRIEYQKPHPRLKYKLFMLYCLAPSIILTLHLWMVNSNSTFLWILLINLPGYGLCTLRYKNYGIWSGSDYTVVRSGLIGHELHVFPNYKVQYLKRSQSILQKRTGVFDVTIQLASKKLKMPYMYATFVEPFIDKALYHVEATNRRWF